MARNKNRAPRNPDDVSEEETQDIEEEDEILDEESSSSETREIELDRQFIYSGRFYGPGKVEVPNEVADSLEKSMERLQEADEKEREAGEAALAGSTQTQVNNTVAPEGMFAEEEKLMRSAQKESKD